MRNYSITDRLALRKSLDCKPFQWYVENVYPELLKHLPTVRETSGAASGAIKYKSLCFDTYGRGAGSHIGLYACHGTGGNQVASQKERWTHGRLTYFVWVHQAWTSDHSGRLRHGSWCLAPPTPAYVGAQVITLPCSSSSDQLWDKLDRGQLRGVSVVHRLSNLCLDARNAQEITVQECHPTLDTQEFIFTRWKCLPSSTPKKKIDSRTYLKCTNCYFTNMLTINNVLVIGRWRSVFFEWHELCARPYEFDILRTSLFTIPT